MRTHALDKPTPLPAKQPTKPALSTVAPYCQALVNCLDLASGSVEAPQSLGITSCARYAGVSTMASGLAELVADGGQQVLLIDAHRRHPSQAQRYGVAPSPGLWELLAAEVTSNEAILPTDFENLCLLPAGCQVYESQRVSSRSVLANLLKQWKERFDLIVLDLPPALLKEPTMSWTSVLDGVLLVVEAERTEAADAKRAKQALIDCEARLLGAVLNKRRSYLPRWLCQ